jgi:UDP-galactopyranose mutase
MVPVSRAAPDVAVVGGGLFGLVCAERLTTLVPGVRVLLVEASDRLGGLCSSTIDPCTGVTYHRSGTHVLATDDDQVRAYITGRTGLVPYRRKVYAAHGDQLVPLPLGLEAVESCYGGPLTAVEARRLVETDTLPYRGGPGRTVEQVALAAVGPRLYEAYVCGYVTKQWGLSPSRLAAEVFTDRFTIRYQCASDYHGQRWQGYPPDGWGPALQALADRPGITVQLGRHASAADPPPFTRACVVTAPVDAWFGHALGTFQRRSLHVDWRLTTPAHVPAKPTITYPGPHVRYYRTHVPALLPPTSPASGDGPVLVGYEYGGPGLSQVDFVLRTPDNARLADRYRQMASTTAADGLVFAGRGSTFYDDMGTTIAAALSTARALAVGPLAPTEAPDQVRRQLRCH